MSLRAILIGTGESDTLIAARIAGENRRVDTDQMAFVVDQRAARVAGVDGRIRLDEVFHLLDAETGAAGGADDTAGHRLAYAERIADGEHDVANFNFARNRPASGRGKFEPSILITAISVRASVPITRALNSRLSCRVTTTEVAPSTTWLLVRI
jgi:hypothetical protein